jgi:hypothetical protein
MPEPHPPIGDSAGVAGSACSRTVARSSAASSVGSPQHWRPWRRVCGAICDLPAGSVGAAVATEAKRTIAANAADPQLTVIPSR